MRIAIAGTAEAAEARAALGDRLGLVEVVDGVDAEGLVVRGDPVEALPALLAAPRRGSPPSGTSPPTRRTPRRRGWRGAAAGDRGADPGGRGPVRAGPVRRPGRPGRAGRERGTWPPPP